MALTDAGDDDDPLEQVEVEAQRVGQDGLDRVGVGHNNEALTRVPR